MALALSLATSAMMFGQQNSSETKAFRKGSVMGFWGWNRAWFGKSDIHFKGQDYDFTLKNVVAHDRPTALDFKHYINLHYITVPQVNYNFTYFIADNLGITLGIDHMKYVMDQDQTVEFKGHIDNPQYASFIQNGKVNLANGDFLKYEHTNGLNYINAGIQKYKPLLNKKNVDLFWGYGVGAGVLVPKSNVTLMGNERSDRFHLAGFGMDGRTSLNLIFWNHLVLKGEFKLAYINLPSVATTLESTKINKANQDFATAEVVFGLGYTFNTRKQK